MVLEVYGQLNSRINLYFVYFKNGYKIILAKLKVVPDINIQKVLLLNQSSFYFNTSDIIFVI